MSMRLRFSSAPGSLLALLALFALLGGCAGRTAPQRALASAPARYTFSSEHLVRSYLGQATASERQAVASPADADSDGVADAKDECPATPGGTAVDAFGCPVPLYVHLRVTHSDSGPETNAAFTGQLRRLAELMRENPASRLRIEGHAQGTNSLARSMAFAKSTRDRLVSEFKVPVARIEILGMGDSAPLVSNDTVEGRRRNQRLEITLKGRYQAKSTSPDSSASQTPSPGSRLRPERPVSSSLAAPMHLRFAYGDASLLPKDQQRLEEIAAFLRANPRARIRIEGHTDSQGSAGFNLELSKRRAMAVQQQLVNALGIDPGRLLIQGKGESEPIADNATATGRASNRRVTVTAAPDSPAPSSPAPTAETRPAPAPAPQRTALGKAPLKKGETYRIEVSLQKCKLWLYKAGSEGRELVRTYTVATPGPGMPRPSGIGQITRIEFDPWWVPTQNIRRRALRKGKRLPRAVPPGRSNPMGKFKLHLSHGQGFRIHGTNQPQLIGQRVSSGCIRMRNDQGLELARAISVGTPVAFIR